MPAIVCQSPVLITEKNLLVSSQNIPPPMNTGSQHSSFIHSFGALDIGKSLEPCFPNNIYKDGFVRVVQVHMWID